MWKCNFVECWDKAPIEQNSLFILVVFTIIVIIGFVCSNK